MKIIKLDEVSSTNNYLKENYQSLDNCQIVTTSFQTKGKGRITRSWESNKSENILLSILVKDLKERSNFETITLFTGCIVHKFLSKYLNNHLIKWPNDILVNKKKICGILVEGISYSNSLKALIIGIGININQISFSEEINNLTTSLKKELNKNFNIDELINELSILLIEELNKYLNNDDTYLTYLRENLFGLNQIIEFEKDHYIYSGKILDIDEDGCLAIEVDNKVIHLRSGEIKIKRN